MRTLKIIEHISLDGVMQHSADDDDFAYEGWTTPYRTPDGGAAVMAAHGDTFDVLLGRVTYDFWAGFWPTAPSSPIGDRINAATKYVATHRPDGLEWGPVEAVGPDLAADVQRIKSADGPPIVMSGSSSLVSPLLEHGLADEMVLIVYPLVLGTGKRLFADGSAPRSLDLVDTTTTSAGLVIATYGTAGPLKTA